MIVFSYSPNKEPDIVIWSRWLTRLSDSAVLEARMKPRARCNVPWLRVMYGLGSRGLRVYSSSKRGLRVSGVRS